MKFVPTVSAIILLLLSAGCFNSANENHQIPESDTATAPAGRNQPQLNIDTIYRFQSMGKQCQLMITKDSAETKDYGMVEQSTVWLIRESDTVFHKTYDQLPGTGEFLNPADGEYWFTLVNSGYGSGYSGTIFHIQPFSNPAILPVVNYNELSYWIIGKDGRSVLAFDGIWNVGNPDDDTFEAHFSAHQQSVAVYRITGANFSMQDLGTTKAKYDLYEDDQGLAKLRAGEIEIVKQFNWEDYFIVPENAE